MLATMIHICTEGIPYLFQDIRRRRIHFGHNNRYWYAQRQRHRKMFLRHADQTSICADNEENKVGRRSRHPEQRAREIFLVSCQVAKRHDLMRSADNVLPAELLTARRTRWRVFDVLFRQRVGMGLGKHFGTVWSKAENLQADTGSAPRLYFVLMPEERYACASTSVIETAFSKH